MDSLDKTDSSATATFRVYVANNSGQTHPGANIAAYDIIPDANTDVGNGAGNSLRVVTGWADDAWFYGSSMQPPEISASGGTDMTIHIQTECRNTDGSMGSQDVSTYLTADGLNTPVGGNQDNSSSSSQPTPATPSSSSPGSSPSAGASTNNTATDQTSTPTTPSLPDSLDTVTGYSTGQGASLQMSTGQAVHFTVSSGSASEQHTATVKTVGASTATITLASHPFDVTLKLGQTSFYDVTGDHHPDIQITLKSIDNGNATFVFHPIKTTATIMNTPTKKHSGTSSRPALIVTGVVAVLSGAVAAVPVTRGIVLKFLRRVSSRSKAPVIKSTKLSKPAKSKNK